MSRSRIWLISTAAVLCTAVPALAYSWPALFGVPGAFGQEASQPPQVAATPARAAYTSTRPVAVIATATSSRSAPGAEECDDNARCQNLGACLSAWQRLWDRGEYARALSLAYSAMQTAPRSLAVQHAVVLSQIMNDLRQARPEGGFEEAEDCRTRCPAAQAGACPLPLSVLMPAVQMPLLPPGAHVYAEGQQPLFIRHFAPPCEGNPPCERSASYTATRCGDGLAYVKDCAVECCADEAKGCCDKCAKECKCCCTKVDKTKPRTASHSVLPTTILIVREQVHVPVQVPVPHVVPLPPPPVMQPVFSYGPAFPSVAVSVPIAECPVSRPAPPVEQRVYQVVGEEYTVPPNPECNVASPGSHVRILQRGGMCFVSSPNFEIRCDRVQSRDGDRIVLEGNVTLVSRRHGQTMTIEAERITLNVSTDQFQIDNARGLEQTRFNVAPVSGPGTITIPLATPPACPPAGYYGTGSAEESNAPTDDPRMSRVRSLMEMRKAEREAYEDAIASRWKDVNSGRTQSQDFLRESISRFLNAKQKESEILQEYEALCEEIRRGVVTNQRNFSTQPAAQPAPGGHSEGYYEVPPVAAPRPR